MKSEVCLGQPGRWGLGSSPLEARHCTESTTKQVLDATGSRSTAGHMGPGTETTGGPSLGAAPSACGVRRNSEPCTSAPHWRGPAGVWRAGRAANGKNRHLVPEVLCRAFWERTEAASQYGLSSNYTRPGTCVMIPGSP